MMVTVFKANIREEILAESSTSRKEQENRKDPRGLFGAVNAAMKAAFHKSLYYQNPMLPLMLFLSTTSSISRVSSASVKGPNILDQKVSGF